MDIKKVKELFRGIAVVIDDEIDNKNANINDIITQIESARIPVLKYKSLPDDETIVHFQNLSFLLLDWNLVGEMGVPVPDSIVEENITFLKELNERCFCPIFIFTNEDTSSVETKLLEEEIVQRGRPSNIFIRKKKSLLLPEQIETNKFSTLIANLEDGDKEVLGKAYRINQNNNAYELDASTTDTRNVTSILDKTDYVHLFEEIGLWLEETPSIYVLKAWEREYHNCKTKLFSDFHSIHPSWPTIMWKNFEADGANKSFEMGELISRNLYSRMTPFEFNNDILDKESNVPRDQLRKVLEGECFLKSASLHETHIGTGDLFKEDLRENGEKYYLNIRAQCDLVRDKNPNLFLLTGYVLKQKENGKIDNISFNQGQYLEKPNHAIVAFLNDGKIIEFKFSDFNIRSWSDIKLFRIGRLLPPYINRIQQRYSLYMQRQGLPRIPDAAIFEATPATGRANE